MEWEQVRQWLQENRDSEGVRAFIREQFPPSLDDVRRFLESDDEGQRWLQAERDRAVSKGIETWKQKTLPGILDEEREKIRKEMNPEETPEQKELRKLREEFEKERRERKREAARNKALKLAMEKGLPVDLLDFIVSEDEEATMTNLATLESAWNNAKKSIVDQQFKDNGRKPVQTPATGYTGKNPWKKETFNLTEQARIIKENPELAKQLQAAAKE